MTVLLDTHFLIWLVLESKRLAKFPWLDRYRPWAVSPVSFLEIQFLAEVGRLSVSNPEFTNTVMKDRRFIIDDISLEKRLFAKRAKDMGSAAVFLAYINCAVVWGVILYSNWHRIQTLEFLKWPPQFLQ